MTLKHISTLAFLAACATTEAAPVESAGPPPPPPPPAAAARVAETPVTRDAAIKQTVRTPHGDVAILILDDGTAVHVPPHVFGAMAPKVKTAVHVEGFSTGSHVRATALKVAGQDVSLGPPATPPPPPGQAPALGAIDETSTIASTIAAPDGSPEVLLLADGASVMLGPPLRSAPLRVGASVHVKGEGGRYDGVTAMHARTLEIGGTTLVDDAPPPPPAPGPGPGPAPGPR